MQKTLEMLAVFKYWCKLFAFFLLFFAIQRLVFVLVQLPQNPDISFMEIVQGNVYALKLDLAASAYVVLLALLLLWIGIFGATKTMIKILKVYVIIILVVIGLIHITDIGLYKEWGSKFNHKALSYLTYPKEAIASAESSPILLFTFIFSAETLFGLFLYTRYVHFKGKMDGRLWQKIVLPLVLVAVTGVVARGGISKWPVSKGSAYYSQRPMLNQAAANSLWNFINILSTPIEARPTSYDFVDPSSAQNELHRLTLCDTSALRITTKSTPNIVIILVESLSAESMGIFGGSPSATPALDGLTKNALLFSRFYASGFRTDQGLAAVVSGFPAQPQTAVIRRYGKFERLNGLGLDLHQKGYTSSYYSAGDNDYANTKAYLKHCGFSNFYDEGDVKPLRRTKFGGYDEFLFAFHLKHVSSLKQPFFSILMTCTSHEPFDAAVPNVFLDRGEANGYLNTIHYTDGAIGDYLKRAQKETWYSNALIFILSDHAHRFPNNRQIWEVERHHIPLIITGGALDENLKGKTISAPLSQTDLPAIILSLVGVDSKNYEWSKTICSDENKSWAFYTFDDGAGFIHGKDTIIWDNALKKTLLPKPGNSNPHLDSLTNTTRTLLQKLIHDYYNLTD